MIYEKYVYYQYIMACQQKTIGAWNYNRGQNICRKCSISAKKKTPQANENHCLRPFVEKQVFRTWLRLKIFLHIDLIRFYHSVKFQISLIIPSQKHSSIRLKAVQQSCFLS